MSVRSLHSPDKFMMRELKGRKVLVLLFLKYFIYLFLERGQGREKEMERSINVWLLPMHPPLGTCPTAQACILTGNIAIDPLSAAWHSIH